MKDDEIKEILDRLDFNEWEVDLYKVPITWSELYTIRDYITNLQEENKELKSELECYENGVYFSSKVDELERENERLKETNVYCNRTDCVGRIKDSKKYDSIYQEKEDYKSRIEKASNLIEPLVEWGECTINGKMLKSVYDILNGGSDE